MKTLKGILFFGILVLGAEVSALNCFSGDRVIAPFKLQVGQNSAFNYSLSSIQKMTAAQGCGSQGSSFKFEKNRIQGKVSFCKRGKAEYSREVASDGCVNRQSLDGRFEVHICPLESGEQITLVLPVDSRDIHSRYILMNMTGSEEVNMMNKLSCS